MNVARSQSAVSVVVVDIVVVDVVNVVVDIVVVDVVNVVVVVVVQKVSSKQVFRLSFSSSVYCLLSDSLRLVHLVFFPDLAARG